MIMKKFLLFAAAALVAVSANAQLASKKDMTKKQATVQQKVALPQAERVNLQLAGEKKNAGKDVFAGRNANKQFTMTDNQVKALKPAQNLKMANTSFRRAAAEEYISTGFDLDEAQAVAWKTYTGTSTDGSKLLVKDLIPNCFGFEQGVLLEYTIEDGVLIIQPQLVASLAERGWYIFVNDYNADDGVIRLEIEDDGYIKTQGLTLEYGVFSSNSFDVTFATYLGYYEREKNCKYRLPGDAPEPPTVMAEPGNTTIFASISASGYGYLSNLSILPAYTEYTLANGTQDYASSWQWKAEEVTEGETDDSEIVTPISAETKDFTFMTNPAASYQKFSLVGYNEDVESEEYTWGYGHYLEDDGTPHYKDSGEQKAFYAFPGGMGSSYTFTDGSSATMTTQNPDGDLTFYINWGTPDKTMTLTNPYSIASVFAYQGKPAAPIYFEGVTIPVVSFAFVDEPNFKLHLNIYKCSRSASGTLTLGELIAQSDVTNENVVSNESGLTEIKFSSFYTEDEDGMSVELPYLQLTDEFVIEIADWDNGTFSAVMGAQDVDVASLPSAYFRRTGEESLRRFTTWFPTLFVGLDEFITGYLHTTDNTDIKIDNAGGEAAINVEAMLRSVNSETGAYDYRIWPEEILVDGESVEEVPEWLSIGIGNISESGTEFTLSFQAAALPEGVAGRKVTVKFMQEGAFLTVNLTQGEPTGISSVKKTTKSGKSLMYNLAGQRVEKTFKGIVIKDGNKVVVK